MRNTNSIRPWTRALPILAWVLAAACAIAAWPAFVLAQVQAQPQQRSDDGVMPKPREATAEERREMESVIRKRFQADEKGEIHVAGGGPYLFATSENFFAIVRKDLGSVAFESKAYGVTDAALTPEQLDKERLLSRIDAALGKTGLEARGRRFAHFQDEFAGAVGGRKDLPADFVPAKASKQVARTVAFERTLDGVPVFGSELLVGLNPDGRIGRFRLHWPKVDPKLAAEARRLGSRLSEKSWKLPKSLEGPGIEILSVSAGVGHSAFADPRFVSAAVVRVLYRETGRNTEYPLVTTGYKYFDAEGKEVRFTSFPRIPGTAREEKVSEKAAEPRP